MEIVVHSKKSVSAEVSKEIVPFQQEFPTYKCDVQNDPIGHPESRQKNRLRLPVLSGIWLQLHPNTSDSLWLRNPAHNATEAQSSCLRQSHETLELWQG